MTNTIFSWLKEKYSLFLNLFLSLLFVDVMIDPTNLIFHVKYVLFGLVVVIWGAASPAKKRLFHPYFWYILLFVAFFMPFYELSVGLLNSIVHNVPVKKMVYFNSFFFFAIVLVTVSERKNLTALFNYASLTIVAMTLGLYLILIFNIRLFGDLYRYFVIDKQVVVYALRNYGKVTMLMIFYKTSPLLVFPLSWYLYHLLIEKKRKMWWLHLLLLLLTALTLYFSGTRANLISLVFIFVFYAGYFLFKKSKIWFIWAVALGLLVVLFLLPSVVTTFLNKQEVSNAIKFSYLSSYADYFDHHWVSLLFGQGVGGMFYAAGLHRFVGVSELTYIELIRIWGIPITLLFVAVLFFPLYAEIKTRKITPIFAAYLAYLFISGTNPLLLSSTGMLVLVYVFTHTFLDADKFPSFSPNTRFVHSVD